MNTRNPRTIILLLTLTALAVGVSPALGLDPLVELQQKRKEEADRRDSNIPGPKAADELLANQDWRNRMATQIALAIEACRYNGGAAKVEGPEVYMNDPARRRVGDLISALTMLKDPRVIPLIAPALRETSPGSDHGDFAIEPPQKEAAGALRTLAITKVITVADPKDSHDYIGWGKWWTENKLNFDEVPEPLKAIDEGRITKTFDPNSVAPEKKSSPETLAQSEAKKAQEAPAVASVPPPQATPDKLAPAVATVTRSGDTSMWFPIAAASAAILLALGIWFYSRTSRA
jgi:hypothetical protein